MNEIQVGMVIHYFPAYDELSIIGYAADLPIAARVARVENLDSRIVSLHFDTFKPKDPNASGMDRGPMTFGYPPRLIYGTVTMARLNSYYDVGGKPGTWRFLQDGLPKPI